jgi:hypothetical protein
MSLNEHDIRFYTMWGHRVTMVMLIYATLRYVTGGMT